MIWLQIFIIRTFKTMLTDTVEYDEEMTQQMIPKRYPCKLS